RTGSCYRSGTTESQPRLRLVILTNLTVSASGTCAIVCCSSTVRHSLSRLGGLTAGQLRGSRFRFSSRRRRVDRVFEAEPLISNERGSPVGAQLCRKAVHITLCPDVPPLNEPKVKLTV